MESTFVLTPASLEAAQVWARTQLEAWGIRGPHVDPWLVRGTQLLPGPRGHVVLCFDPSDRLLSLDVWCDGKRVFGMDDLL